jgi:hypothetical protein
MQQSFRSRSLYIDDISHEVLKVLVALGGYCTAQQARFLLSLSTRLGISSRDAGTPAAAAFLAAPA